MAQARQAVWDIPTRLVHWLIVVLVVAAWWTAQTDKMDLHLYAGYAVLGLLIFRIYWGFVGGSTARFSSFVRGPGAVVRYARDVFRRKSETGLGHNPLGALSVLALLGLMVVQVSLGLFAVNVDGDESGPLSYMVSFDQGRAFAEAHDLLFNVLVGLIALHLAAIVFYLLVQRENLVAPMIRGWRRSTSPEALRGAPLWRLLAGVGVAAFATWLIAKGMRI